MIRIAALTVLVGLAGCGEPEPARPTPTDAAPRSATVPDSRYQLEAEDRVRELLRAPDSARFDSVAVRRTGEVTAVCGFVNAQNALGGMTGRKRFISNGASVTVLEDQMASGEFAEVWNSLCV